MKVEHTLLCLLIACVSIILAQAESVAIEGYLRGSPELVRQLSQKPDFSNVKINLYTTDGILKDSVNCAPTGFYVVAVYDRGTYSLEVEGPEGWSFEPRKVSVNAEHHKGEDIDFVFTGFTVSGQVVGESAETCQKSTENGAAAIKVALVDHAGQVAKETLSGADGSYLFTQVVPGTYTVRTSTKKSTERTVTVTWSNERIAEPIVVSGFAVNGRVLSGDSGVQGVDVYLVGNAPSFKCDRSVEQAPVEGALCVQTTDASGRFSFDQVPCGEYRVVPHYKGFRVSPDSRSVSMLFGDVASEQSFQVLGFSVSGRVVDQQGRGIADAAILLNGKEKTKSNSDGSYSLDELTSGSYTVSAKKDHHFFSSLQNTKIQPGTGSLSDITVDRYHLCGSINVDRAFLAANSAVKLARREVTLRSPETKAQKVQTDASGRFCFEVAPGTYDVSTTLSAEDKKAGLLLTPNPAIVTVANAPVLNADLNQVLLSVSATVVCVEQPCDSAVTVNLTPTSRRGSARSVSIANGEAVFSQVLPGEYEVTVQRDGWCWEREFAAIEVKDKAVSGIEFRQRGYELNAVLSHDGVTLKAELDGQQDASFTLAPHKGSNKVCLERAGTYRITPVSCFKFEEDVFVFDTRSPRVLELDAAAYKVQGSIAAKQEGEISVRVRQVSASGKTKADTETVIPTTLVSSENGVYNYEYIHWATPGETFEVEPQSSTLLFYPRTRVVTAPRSDSCPQPIPAIDARQGLYLSGSVSPAISGVKISVSSKDGQFESTMLTDAEGKYKAGPLYDDIQYSVAATKEGFHFKEDTTSGNFRSFKFSQITVQVKDETSQALSEVILSLSGEKYRNTSQTGASGSLLFAGLHSGEYYLRPLLKEYEFDPKYATISLEEGEERLVTISARRVAFSCYGSVQSLNGEPEERIPIEAVGPNGEYEETQTDAKGSFRLRGLAPNVKYTVRVKQSESARVERASPASIEVTPARSDVTGLRFIIFRAPNTVDIVGTVQTSAEFIPALEVELLSNGRVIKSTPLTVTRYFEFPSVSRDSASTYSVRVSPKLSPRTHKFEIVSAPVAISSESSVAEVSLEFTAIPYSAAAEGSRFPFGIVFLAAMVWAIFNPAKALEVAQKTQSRVIRALPLKLRRAIGGSSKAKRS